jgi:hypothetical protein
MEAWRLPSMESSCVAFFGCCTTNPERLALPSPSEEANYTEKTIRQKIFVQIISQTVLFNVGNWRIAMPCHFVPI